MFKPALMFVKVTVNSLVWPVASASEGGLTATAIPARPATEGVQVDGLPPTLVTRRLPVRGRALVGCVQPARHEFRALWPLDAERVGWNARLNEMIGDPERKIRPSVPAVERSVQRHVTPCGVCA